MPQTKSEALDQALLFLSSIVVILFIAAIGLVLKPSLLELITLLPFLFISAVLPLYVGYLRGVVELASNA
ncbi:MAG: hypothetical protein ACRECH_18365, partial [Nitrososphaerales archaeon]